MNPRDRRQPLEYPGNSILLIRQHSHEVLLNLLLLELQFLGEHLVSIEECVRSAFTDPFTVGHLLDGQVSRSLNHCRESLLLSLDLVSELLMLLAQNVPHFENAIFELLKSFRTKVFQDHITELVIAVVPIIELTRKLLLLGLDRLLELLHTLAQNRLAGAIAVSGDPFQLLGLEGLD